MSMEERTALLLGQEGVEKLRRTMVLLFGLGGVGGYTAEALARAGVGSLTLVDDDRVGESNLNRQLLALRSTLGMRKTEAAARRILDINPDCQVRQVNLFYTPATADQLPFEGYDYVIDAVDTVSAKLEILARAQAARVPVISCMGTGNKLEPEKLCLTTLEKTSGCPLARVMRKECRARGIRDVKVVYSTEPPRPLFPVRQSGEDAPPQEDPPRPGKPKTNVPGSVSFVPGAAGLILAGAVVRDLTGIR